MKKMIRIKLFESFVNEKKKNYTAGDKRKDNRRIEDMLTKSKDDEHFLKLAKTMANSIKNGEKAYNRGLAAQAQQHKEVADIFLDRAKELGWEV